MLKRDPVPTLLVLLLTTLIAFIVYSLGYADVATPLVATAQVN